MVQVRPCDGGQVLRCGKLSWHVSSLTSAAHPVLSASKHVWLCGRYECIELVPIDIFSLIPSRTFQTRAGYVRRLVKDTLSQSSERWELVWPGLAAQNCPCLPSPSGIGTHQLGPLNLTKAPLVTTLPQVNRQQRKSGGGRAGWLRLTACTGSVRDGAFGIHKGSKRSWRQRTKWQQRSKKKKSGQEPSEICFLGPFSCQRLFFTSCLAYPLFSEPHWVKTHKFNFNCYIRTLRI